MSDHERLANPLCEDLTYVRRDSGRSAPAAIAGESRSDPRAVPGHGPGVAAWGIGGWLLTPFLQKAGLARVAQLRDQVAAGLRTTFTSSYTAQVSLPGALSLEAIAGYGRQATGSKYVIIPSRAA